VISIIISDFLQVLVAGQRGNNRSAGLLVGLAMRHAGLSLREAVHHVAARRTIDLDDTVVSALQQVYRKSAQ